MILAWVLDRSPAVLAYSPGGRALRGVPRWDRRYGREPDFVVLTSLGVVVLVDSWAGGRRRQLLRAWCDRASRSTPWSFRYRVLSPSLVARLLRGAIA
jgi:hypothetical protein